MVFATERIRAQAKTQVQTMNVPSRFVFSPTHVADTLRANISGQENVIGRIEDQLQVISAGLCDPRRPLLSALFIGATGVGKTEMVRQVAKAIHGRDDAFCRIDMNTLSQSHYSAAITGAPPGYVGSKENLSLFDDELITGTNSRPGIVLFDEIEKADRSVVLSLMNILDNGTLKLASGQKSISFRNTLVFMTSNVGSRMAESLHWLDAIPGFSRAGIYRSALKRHFNTEFISRIGLIEYFSALPAQAMPSLIEKLEDELNQKLKRHRVSIELDQHAREFVLAESQFQRYGARAIERTFRNLVTTAVARDLNALNQYHEAAGATHFQGVLNQNGLSFLPVNLSDPSAESTPTSPLATQGENHD